MLRIMTFIALACPFLAFASIDGQSLSYSVLQNAFQSASNTTIGKLRGVWSGRCIDHHAQNVELNGLLVYEKSSMKSDHSPRYLNADYFTISEHHARNGKALPADYNDNLNWRSDAQLYWPIESLWDTSLTPASESTGTVTWTTGDVLSTAKEVQGNILVEVTAQSPATIYSGSLGKNVREQAGPITYCRFFKKL